MGRPPGATIDRSAFWPLPRDVSWLTILVYHGLTEDPARLAARSLEITPRRCLDEIRLLESLGYRLVSAEDLDGLMTDPRPGGHLLVTFDDGHLETFEPLLQLLRDEGIPLLLAVCPGIAARQGTAEGVYWWEEARARFATSGRRRLFFTTEGESWRCRLDDIDEFERRCLQSAVGRRSLMRQLRGQTRAVSVEQVRHALPVHRNMGWEEVAALNRHGHCTIACHSLFHDTATSQSATALGRDASLCRRLMEHHLGTASRHFVYPNGACDQRTDRVLGRCGFRFTYSVVGAPNLLPTPAVGRAGERARRQGTRVRRLHRFHGFGYDPADHAAYARQFNLRHRSLH